jgi:lipopolysaccharide/colanic/teichoic acid biosynthesis glycosyltransferase
LPGARTGSLEAIIGKTRIDELDTLPLVDIEYNLHKPWNRFLKRTFDVMLAALLLVTVYPLAWMAGRRRGMIAGLPAVLRGQMSFVGLPAGDRGTDPLSGRAGFLGPAGLTGLVQLNGREDLDEQEKERYRLYYAKNQSLVLDMEILVKTLLAARKN